jgi:hypothetical protein
MVLLVHVASVWVPFTSESKEAIAHYAEILKEIRLALQECGRKLGTYLRRRDNARREERRRGIFEMYIGELWNRSGAHEGGRKQVQAGWQAGAPAHRRRRGRGRGLRRADAARAQRIHASRRHRR